ncbi:monofunctional biosynthetic peptidoglycan transglycosylase [Escherichia coli HVH 182 (4-0985554)]|nr:monofunctional biosynthetic peptidoglycan transglycosylase [Escherichia coli HVH 182 (4-0985554)]
MSKSRLTVFSFIRRFLLRLMVVLAVFWGGGIALFSVAPVPFSAVMVERQVSAWLHGNFRYVAHSDWVNMDQISPWMGLAVIAAEDQKFPEHWGFDVASIEQALAHNERNENRIRGASTISQQTAKNLFLWDGRSWVRKGLEAGLTLGIETVWSKKRILTPEYRRIWRRCVWRRSCGTTLFPQTREQTYPLGSCITGCCIT